MSKCKKGCLGCDKCLHKSLMCHDEPCASCDHYTGEKDNCNWEAKKELAHPTSITAKQLIELDACESGFKDFVTEFGVSMDVTEENINWIEQTIPNGIEFIAGNIFNSNARNAVALIEELFNKPQKIAVADRVRIKNGSFSGVHEGDTGTVIYHNGGWYIRLDKLRKNGGANADEALIRKRYELYTTDDDWKDDLEIINYEDGKDKK